MWISRAYHSLVTSLRPKEQPHLLCWVRKINGSEIEENLFPLTCFSTFYYTLAELGIEKSIFIKPNTFHLTVLMLKLWNKDRVNAARDVLKVKFLSKEMVLNVDSF